MRHMLAVVVALAVAACLVGVAWAGGTIPIAVNDDPDTFTPKKATHTFGDGGFSFAWAGTDDGHNVVQDRRLFRSGAPVESDSLNLIDLSAGRFPYYCEAHGGKGGEGMAGTLRVRPVQGILPRARRGLSVPVTWATTPSPSGDQFDVQYKVGDGRWKDWKKNTSKTSGGFGDDGKPVTVAPTKTYRIRVRSEDSDHPKRQSGFSPPMLVGFS